MSSLSEGNVLLTRPHTGPGVLVHSEEKGRFVTLYCSKAARLTPSERDGEGDATVSVVVGHAAHALVCQVDQNKGAHEIFRNVWVGQGEEVWISTTQVGAHAVFGFAKRRPF